MRFQHIVFLGLGACAVFVIGYFVIQLNQNSDDEETQRLSLSEIEYSEEFPDVDDFFMLLDDNPSQSELGFRNIVNHWRPANAIMLVEVLAFVLETPREPMIKNLLATKLEMTGGYDKDTAFKWGWANTTKQHPEYAAFKSNLYGMIDPRFREYFDSKETTVRLDEIRWGGVIQDGIPPLDKPKMITADEADYLNESDVVYALEINGDARAYPERIISWHEMFKDTVGGVSVCGVYCTLCGTMILYETEFDGVHHELGTSGFLYRSNKLMYDKATSSLWFTLTGEPVVGDLVGKGIKLRQRSLVKTTWLQWKAMHPDTKVLSLDTGMDKHPQSGEVLRHYRHSPYQEYLDGDDLMFSVPLSDDRLKDKDAVVSLRSDSPDDQLAIHVDFLRSNKIYHDKIGDKSIVVITDESAASRVYECGEIRFQKLNDDGSIQDTNRNQWTITEAELAGPGDQRLKRYPAHRSFWFGWFNAFPNTRLVK